MNDTSCEGTLPNGLAFAANGDILIANFGTDLLEVMTRDGATRTLHDRICDTRVVTDASSPSRSRRTPEDPSYVTLKGL